MSPKRFFFVMVGVFSLSIVGGGAMLYFANTMLQKRSSSVVDLKLQSSEVEAQLTAYQAAKKDVQQYSYLNDIIASALPQDKDQARTVREIFLLANQSGIAIKSVQFPSSSLGAVVAPVAGATPAATPATPVAAPTPAITQAKPVTGLNGVYSIETIVTPFADDKNNKVTYAQLISFLQKIESNRRAMQVASIQLNPLGQNTSDSISFTLTLNIFIRP
ncbi:MAG: hypothetical protein JWO47_340 [Candidatus Saccharibacteria bacterium]|nr:hypothetical protein [Candidatus Saccharibacteria bacterium]